MITYTILVVPCYRYNIIYRQTPILIIKAPIHHSTLIEPLSRTPLKDPLKEPYILFFQAPFGRLPACFSDHKPAKRPEASNQLSGRYTYFGYYCCLLLLLL